MGLHRGQLLGSVTGVAVGIWNTEFAQVLAQTPRGRSVYASTGATLSIACGRVSFVLGLQGPCATFETACSASLVACHSAMRAMQHLECESHLVVGVNLMLTQTGPLGMAIAGMTSLTGRSHMFDSRADGFARGEGASSFSMAPDGGDLGVQGSAVRQDGRSASLTAPSGPAQQALLRAALADAKLTADDLALGEAHGTGTALGDPIEAGALESAVVSERSVGPKLVLAGVKGNLAHGESMAGAVGLLEVIARLKSSEGAPNAQLRVLNPRVRGALRSGKLGLPTQNAPLSHAVRAGGAS
eukprot:3676726-Prymnesium_polylepis.1